MAATRGWDDDLRRRIITGGSGQPTMFAVIHCDLVCGFIGTTVESPQELISVTAAYAKHPRNYQENIMNPAMVTSALELPGYRVVANVGIVRGIVVRSRSIIGNFFGGLQTILGGNISIYTNLCERARTDAYKIMCNHANNSGANAIIGMRYDATELMAGVTEVLCYGTAVKVVPIENP
jgi:uncharacterized protein YbjQ (UPF0145 family)